MKIRLLPNNRAGDYVIAWLKFVRRHRRFPSSKAMLWNDVLFRLKTTAALQDPLRAFVSDKEHVKTFVKAVVGQKYNVPTLGVIRHVHDVRSFPFPADCCIKPTHSSGAVILRRSNEPIDFKQIEGWFSLNQYTIGREINYRYLQPKVIVEPLIFGSDNVEDYKFHCFNGAPKIIQVDIDRHAGHRHTLLDRDWNDLGYSTGCPKAETLPDRPANLDRMCDIAGQLAQNFHGYIRIDLYSDGNTVLLGEITNVSNNAQGRFVPVSAEQKASSLLFGPQNGQSRT